MKFLLHHLRTTGKIKLYMWLLFSAIACALLLFLRMRITGSSMYIFLAWNLFLAAIPLALSMIIVTSTRIRKHALLFIPAVFTWLVFFPNSPYIITDILHFRYASSGPAWFDVLLLMMFSWTGLITGFVSLTEIQTVISEKYSRTISSLFVIVALVLGSFGVYIGRFLRWNTWDVLRNPGDLARDIFDRVTSPFDHPRTYAVTFVLSLFMIVSYFTIRHFNTSSASARKQP